MWDSRKGVTGVSKETRRRVFASIFRPFFATIGDSDQVCRFLVIGSRVMRSLVAARGLFSRFRRVRGANGDNVPFGHPTYEDDEVIVLEF
uniref:Uncharacterized protein n=1 Tax=Daucus carota subsp. sativus TaxID=79200 RepID=A0A162AK88_DAUCS